MHSQRSLARRVRLSALGLAMAMSAALAGAQDFGQPDTDFRGSVRAANPIVLPGGEVELAGSDFRPGQRITLLRGETELNPQPYVADAEGRFAATVRIPGDAVAGRHPVIVRVADPDAAAVFDLKVSREVPLSGAERFEVAQERLVQGLYQSAYSAANDALFVTAAVGRPPVTESELLKLDPQSLEIVARVTPDRVPGRDDGRVFAVYGVGVDDANGRVWVTNTREDTVAVYRQSDLSLVRQYGIGAVPHARDVIVDGERERVYASAFGENFLAVFDARSLEPLQPVAIESTLRGERFRPMSLVIDQAAGKLYTVSMPTGEAAVIDVASGDVDRVFRLPNANAASGVAVDPERDRLYVASQGSDNLLIVDLASGDVLHDVYVGAGALNVALDPVSKLAFVPNRGAGTVTVVNGDGEIVANLEGGTFPNHAAVDGRGTVYAVNKSRGADDPAGDHIRRIAPASP